MKNGHRPVDRPFLFDFWQGTDYEALIWAALVCYKHLRLPSHRLFLITLGHHD